MKISISNLGKVKCAKMEFELENNFVDEFIDPEQEAELFGEQTQQQQQQVLQQQQQQQQSNVQRQQEVVGRDECGGGGTSWSEVAPLMERHPQPDRDVSGCSATIAFEKTLEEAKAPKRRYGSSGYDLHSCETVYLYPNEPQTVSLGLLVKLPKGTFGMIVPRSTKLVKAIEVVGGQQIVAEGFQGSLAVNVVSRKKQVIKKGDRLVELIVIPYVNVTWLDKTVCVKRSGGAFKRKRRSH